MLRVGSIYSGNFNTKPVRFIGLSFDTELRNNENGGILVLWEFQYVLKEDKPDPKKGGVSGYKQTEEQVKQECYMLVQSLDVLYGDA